MNVFGQVGPAEAAVADFSQDLVAIAQDLPGAAVAGGQHLAAEPTKAATGGVFVILTAVDRHGTSTRDSGRCKGRSRRFPLSPQRAQPGRWQAVLWQNALLFQIIDFV